MADEFYDPPEKTKTNLSLVRFTNKDRLTDRYLTTQFHHLEVANKRVVLAISLEINNPWHPASQYGQLLINTLIKDFSQSESPSLLLGFERALKSVNLVLEKAYEKLSTTIGAVVALIYEDNVHFSAIGSSEILLQRSQKVIKLYPQSEADQAKYFAEVTSGDLKAGELILAGTKLFGQTFEDNQPLPIQTVDDLSEMMTSTFLKLDEPLRQLLSGFCVVNPKQPAEQTEKTIFWEELRAFVPVKLPRLRLPTGWLTSLTHKLSSLGRAIGQKLPRNDDKNKEAQPDQVEPDGDQELEPVARPRRRLPRINLNLIGLIIFILLLVFGVKLGKERFASLKKEIKQPTLVDDLSSAPPDKYLSLLDSKLDVKSFSALSGEDQKKLTETLASKGIKLTSLPAVKNELPELGLDIDVTDSTIFVVDSTGQCWKLDKDVLTKIDQSQPIVAPTDVIAINANSALVTDKSGTIWSVSAKDRQVKALALPSAIATGQKLLQLFNKNLYIYSTDSKSFYKISRFNGQIANPSMFVRAQTVDNFELTDWSVDSQIIAIDSNGMVKSFKADKVGDVSFRAITDGIPIRLKTNPNDDTIWVSSGKLLVSYDSKGQLTSQRYLISSEPINNIRLDSDGKSIWLLIGKSVYLLPV